MGKFEVIIIVKRNVHHLIFQCGVYEERMLFDFGIHMFLFMFDGAVGSVLLPKYGVALDIGCGIILFVSIVYKSLNGVELAGQTRKVHRYINIYRWRWLKKHFAALLVKVLENRAIMRFG